MPVPTISDIRARFGVSSQISDTRLTACLDASLRWAKRKLGIEEYNAVFNAGATEIDDSAYLDADATTTEEIALRLGECTDAVLHHAAACVVKNTSVRLRESGIVKREQDAGSGGRGDNAVINDYLSPSEVAQVAGMFLADAENLIAPYVVEQEPVASVFQIGLERG